MSGKVKVHKDEVDQLCQCAEALTKLPADNAEEDPDDLPVLLREAARKPDYVEDTGSRDLDLIQIYLNEIHSFPLLTREEEEDYSIRIRQGDETARSKLIEANLRLVFSAARHFSRYGADLNELIQEGNLGLIRAAETYDHEKAYRFSTYAMYFISGKMKQEVAKSRGGVLSRTRYADDQIRKISKETAEFQNEFGREPTEEELAARTGIKPKQLRALKAASLPALSVDQPVGDDGEAVFGDVIPDRNTPDPQTEAEEKQLREQYRQTILHALEKLRPDQKTILLMYYGLQGEPPHSPEEIADWLNRQGISVNAERVRQIRIQSLRILFNPELLKSIQKYRS